MYRLECAWRNPSGGLKFGITFSSPLGTPLDMAEAAAAAAAELKLFNESIAPSFADSNQLCPVNTPWELRDKNGKV
jgi:hypothetical protein